MFRNYLKIAIRDIKNQKAFSAIKIFSLAIGLATSVLILIWVQYELSFDMFHENSDSIYRMASSYEFNGIERTAPWFPRPMGQALKESFPEVIDYARYDHRRNFDRIQYGDVVDYGSTLLMTDRSFFEVFDFTFLEGNPETALSDLNSVVITEKMAEKFFGDEDPVGKILLFLDKKIPTKITGVLKNIPENSHIQFDYLVPVGISDKWWGGGSERSEWDAAYTSVYLHIRDDFVKDDLERKIVEFYKQKSNTKGIENIEVWLEPLSDIHLRSDLFYDHANNSKGNIIHVYVFIFIAVSVLFIACVNFMNLSTARSAKRSLEVGIRKVNGAYKKDIIKQFLSESVFMSFVALMIAIVLVYTLIPVLRELSGRELDLSFLDNGKILLYVLLITLGTGLISGSYPAFFLSSVDLVNVLKSKYGSGKISVFNFRRFLVVFQFLCTTVLIVISLVIYFQLDFIKNKDLGFDKENILSFTYHREFWGKFDTLKEELLKNPDISYVTSGFSPSMNKRGHAFGGIDWEGKAVDQNVPMDLYFAYYDFPEALGIEMAEGRYFSKDHPGDGKQYVLNEAAIKAMGMKDPIGKTFTPDPGLDGKIIGVIKDFHTSTLKAKIVPTYFICKPNIRAIVRISPDNIDQTIEYVESIWNQFLPDREFEYYFLDDELNEFYRDDRKSAKIIQYFALLTLFVSCIGLLGLVSYYTEQKTKEIGIRKTLGASVAGIISLISREFIIMVAIGNFIALPLSYIIGREWLDTFAYRIGLDWWIFGLSTLVLLVITLLTIKYQTIKAAMMNPTDALRYE
ncbi:MAG: FtsX-like permease family protein [bacterium]|nr:FtsX-like permease family protein [bacterium]